MCGIAGSFCREEAFALYEANLIRGRFSAGLLVNYGLDKTPTIIKTPIAFTEDQMPIGGESYLFHSRAPTSRTIEYREEDTHPFVVGSLYVAHNGIITNANELIEKYDIDLSNPSASLVDSYVIPCVISAKMHKMHLIGSIIETLNELTGTFGLWIYSQLGNEIFICRSGSTLYTNHKGSFSSGPAEGFELLPEGELFYNDKKGILSVGEFKTKPMYFFA